MHDSDDEFPSVTKEFSSSCTIFLFPYQVSLESEHHFSDPHEGEAPGPEELDLDHGNLSSGVQGFSFLGPQADKSSKEICGGDSEPAHQEL